MSTNTSRSVWLITGCSAGLGWELALAAQQAGHIVIASSRNPSKNTDKVRRIEENGGSWFPLDVTSHELEKQLDMVLEKHGRVDVLVNNAGFAVCGTVEDTSLEQQLLLMQTNYFGPLRTMRHLIPSMRERKSGTIVSITSSEGIRVMPTLGGYAATKHALEAITFAVRQEMAEFGIRAFTVAPGGIRTGFNDAASLVGLSEPYKGTVSEHVMNSLLAFGGNQPGDPKKMAQRIVEAVDRNGLVKAVVERGDGFDSLDWIPLGSDFGPVAKQVGSGWEAKAEKLQGIWASVDCEDSVHETE